MFYFLWGYWSGKTVTNVFVCFLFARRLRLITEEKSKYREQPRLKILRNFWDKIQNIKFDSWYPRKWRVDFGGAQLGLRPLPVINLSAKIWAGMQIKEIISSEHSRQNVVIGKSYFEGIAIFIWRKRMLVQVQPRPQKSIVTITVTSKFHCHWTLKDFCYWIFFDFNSMLG